MHPLHEFLKSNGFLVHEPLGEQKNQLPTEGLGHAFGSGARHGQFDELNAEKEFPTRLARMKFITALRGMLPGSNLAGGGTEVWRLLTKDVRCAVTEPRKNIHLFIRLLLKKKSTG